MIFGVDTSVPVTQATLDGVTHAITKPAFWGRYLTGDEYEFGPSDIALLRSSAIKLLPIYQATTAHPSLLHGPNSGGQGTKDAKAAIAAATAHGVPSGSGIAIYADIEGSYTVSVAWLSAWTQQVGGSGFVPGTYCGSDRTGITDAYANISHEERLALLVWSNSPCYYTSAHWSIAGMPTSMGATPISAGGGIHEADIWQYAIPKEGDARQIDLDVCNQRAYAAMWSL